MWEWLASNVFATLSLMLGVIVVQLARDNDYVLVDRFVFISTVVMSVVFFIVLLYILAIQRVSGIKLIDSLRESKLVIIPVQSLLHILLGVFFVKTEINHSAEAVQNPRPAPSKISSTGQEQ